MKLFAEEFILVDNFLRENKTFRDDSLGSQAKQS